MHILRILAVFGLILLSMAASLIASAQVTLEKTGLSDPSKLIVFRGTYYATVENATVSNMEIRGNIVIEASNVTMRNVRLVSDVPWHALRVMEGTTGFRLEDSEINGLGRTVNAIYGFGTFLRNDIHGVENGINVVAPSIVRGNYIHDLGAGPDGHYDGIEINGGHDIQIVGNRIVNEHDQTSAVMMNNEFSGLSRITIENNVLFGGGYTIYLDGRKGGGDVDDTSIRITGNQIGGGRWGDFAFYDSRPTLKDNTTRK
ncbi:right-handed parallel beta-helix repeat-containing protein [Shinella sp. CPCC 101442]|uniref:right-handed parallel beta-helix repeat-containing protein n=1 Tax=Shinella sp. CPCC 101442 TaxID=2932265 RepID=UPI0021526329|nr:right-handed parallel beta-helix repeat-containing protein [Shinella sp. CPCC 101442]MCR6502415.1 right-handed parallel beta-helix repeat-containing protein [Shinella sp. CPCC 101442]